MNNVKSLFIEMVKSVDMVMFNCYTSDLPLVNFRLKIKNVRGGNPGREIFFEHSEGKLTDIFEDLVSYDLNADID